MIHIKLLATLITVQFFLVFISSEASRESCKDFFSDQIFDFHFLKRPNRKSDGPAEDINSMLIPGFENIKSCGASSSHMERFDSIKNISISKIIAASGHNVLRNPFQLNDLSNHIKSCNGGCFRHDPILINIVTEGEKRVVSVDLWNAHHRMVAYIKSGYRLISDLDPSNLTILVNGHNSNGELYAHFVSVAGIDIESFRSFHVLPPGGYIRNGTLSVDGRLSNYELGSKNTIGQLYKNTFHPGRRSVGIYFGTFDPIHEGHIANIRTAIKKLNLKEVVIVPNIEPLHKPMATPINHRREMIAIRIRNEDRINLYTASSDEVIDRFGRTPFVERISHIYTTGNLFQIVGTDSYMKLFSEGKITPDSNRKYLVMKRIEEDIIEVPEQLTHVVSVFTPEGINGLSSSIYTGASQQRHYTSFG